MRASCDSDSEAASRLGIARSTFQNRMKRAAERGLVAPGVETMPGYRIDALTTTPNGTYIKQRKEHGEEYTPTLPVKGKTTLVDAEGRIITQHIMERATAEAQKAALEAVAAGLADNLPRSVPISAPSYTIDTLLNLYVLTDAHLGSLAWGEETGSGDYDLKIAEALIDDWFAAAIDLAPPSETAILAQLGDLLHYDSFESVTPAHRHILDGDSRFDKMVRVAIRVVRKIIRRLLTKHQNVHVVMADANHDPAGGAWLRGWLAAHYEDEQRVSVDDSPGTYYAYRHGNVSLFLHHGHKRKIGDVDSVFAGRYREIYGSTKFSYAHLGHLHSDELKSTNLMKVERHETLAAPDAYAANGGWLSGRSAKVITYSKEHGEVARLTLTPGMVAGAAKREAANDNEPRRDVA
jgi:hypothetical protein